MPYADNLYIVDKKPKLVNKYIPLSPKMRNLEQLTPEDVVAGLRLNKPPTPNFCDMKGYAPGGFSQILAAIKANALGTTNLANSSLEGTANLRERLASNVANLALGLNPEEVDGYVKPDGTSSNRVLIDHAGKVTGRDLVVCSGLAHKSVHQAAKIKVRKVPVDAGAGFQMDQKALLSALTPDVGILTLTGGTTELGIVEMLSPEVEERCRELGIWIHLDAAFGGMNIGCLPEKYAQRNDLRKIAASPAVGSITVCPHKFVGNYGCSIAFLKAQNAKVDSSYIPGANALSGTTASMETAYKTNRLMEKLGQKGLQELAEGTYRAANYFSRVLKSLGIETLIKVTSGIVPIKLPSKESATFLCANLRNLGFSVPEPFTIQTTEGEVYGVRIVFTPNVYYDVPFLEYFAQIVAYIIEKYVKSQAIDKSC